MPLAILSTTTKLPMLGTIVPTSLLNLLSLSLDRHQSALFTSQIGLTAAAAATITITTPTTTTSGRSCTTRGNQSGIAVTMTLPIPVQLHGRPKQLLPDPPPATVDTRLMDVHVLPIFTTIFKELFFFHFAASKGE
ncbi:hypothetical protein DAPPUDRAFT_307835 [Daphnia pulex]|uniref:Uncharacterized protein n=1 Tax=Daphnia pulex TaxID=6669 RepID=E9G1N3_DAPPU|nr:hypothetical protein DAPPUDRAFT_307835 [Daphnia pulex]|eukprot:EFX86524.1 hypothetical protein DAPPUDRAFT_307835 [Daphnia pulex]